MRKQKELSTKRKAVRRLALQNMSVYTLVLLCLLGAFSFVIVLRYGWLQLVEGNQLAERVRRETGDQVIMQSPRGAILDRNGRELAVSLITKSLFIDPNSVQDAAAVETKLAPLIGMKPEQIHRAIMQGGGFVWLKRHLSLSEYQAVRKLILDEEWNCLGFQEEPMRYYPNDMLAANVLGFVGADDVGLDGIEQAYDDMAKGVAVGSFAKLDNANRPIFDSIFSRSYQGDKCKTIELTLDSQVQFIVEQALDEAMVTTQPTAVTAVVMNPKNGEILAMASRPSYNPNRFDEYPAANWKNRAVSSIYEPGSTFKSVVAAAALQEQAVTPNQVFVDPGYVMVSERRIQNWNGESFGTVTFTDVVKNSLNTGFALVGLDLGAVRLNKYAKLFGFGEPTGIELPGEESGILFESDEMRDSDMATMAIGQSIAVTPLQLITAMSAIANDGILMKPHIVKTVRNADGSVYEETRPEEVRRTIDSVTDKTLIGLLEQVVATGGGGKAAVRGYRIAGKTGTAQKINENGAGYMDGHYIASFCGFAPVEDPQLTVLVIIDDPSGIYYGGQIAAPVAGEIFSQLFRYLHIEPSSDPFKGITPGQPVRSSQKQPRPENESTTVPPVVGLDAAETQLTLEAAGLKLQPTGRGMARTQSPVPGTTVPKGSAVSVTFAPGD